MATLPPITGLLRLTCAEDGTVQARVTLKTFFGDARSRMVSQTYDVNPDEIPDNIAAQLQDVVTRMMETRSMDLYRQTFEAMSVAQRMGEEL